MLTIVAGLEFTFALVVASAAFYAGRVYERFFHEHKKERP